MYIYTLQSYRRFVGEGDNELGMENPCETKYTMVMRYGKWKLLIEVLFIDLSQIGSNII